VAVLLPSRRVTPLAAVGARAALAFALLLLSTAIVYLGRHGYRDSARLGHPLDLLGSLYYAAVTLSTTGYYGTKGRSALASLREAGMSAASVVVVVDLVPEVVAEANRAGLAGITGDATARGQGACARRSRVRQRRGR